MGALVTFLIPLVLIGAGINVIFLLFCVVDIWEYKTRYNCNWRTAYKIFVKKGL